jgi:hypothetical protein
MIFYHFTSRYHLPFILEEGLTRGDVPISKDLSTQAVNLTTDGRAHHQKYNQTSYFIYMGKKHKLDKSEIRITIELDAELPLLIHWPKLTAMLNMDQAWLDHLHRNNTGEAWYLYFGSIPFGQFKAVEINSNGNGKWQDINTLAEPIKLVTDKFMFQTSADVEGLNITRIPQDEFIRTYFGV